MTDAKSRGQDPTPEALQESIKSGFESVKHLTTLNAGSIVLIATFLRDIFPPTIDELLKWLIALSFLFFAISLAGAAIAMWYFSVMVRSWRPFQQIRGRYRTAIAAPSFCFVYGLCCFGMAVLINLFKVKSLTTKIWLIDLLAVIFVGCITAYFAYYAYKDDPQGTSKARRFAVSTTLMVVLVGLIGGFVLVSNQAGIFR